MPLYFFHTADGGRDFDHEGVDLPNADAAHLEAIQHAGETLRHHPQELWNHGQWRIEVSDETGSLIFTVLTIAIEAPRLTRSPANVVPRP